MEMPRSQSIGYYIKREINKKAIEGIVDKHKYNDSLSATRLGKMDNETYNSLPVGPMYDVILKKKLARKYGREVVEDVLIDVAGFVYPVDFVILDIKKDKHMPLISGTPFLTTARAEIKFNKDSMTLKAGRYKIRFVRTLEFPSNIEERIERDIDPMIPTNYVHRRILEWDERIDNFHKDEIRFSK
ncbi:zf-CCHC domain-containing protein [Tanacetum coccineum]